MKNRISLVIFDGNGTSALLGRESTLGKYWYILSLAILQKNMCPWPILICQYWQLANQQFLSLGYRFVLTLLKYRFSCRKEESQLNPMNITTTVIVEMSRRSDDPATSTRIFAQRYFRYQIIWPTKGSDIKLFTFLGLEEFTLGLYVFGALLLSYKSIPNAWRE